MSDFAGSSVASQRSSSSTVAVQPSKSSGVFPAAAMRSITSVDMAVPIQYPCKALVASAWPTEIGLHTRAAERCENR